MRPRAAPILVAMVLAAACGSDAATPEIESATPTAQPASSTTAAPTTTVAPPPSTTAADSVGARPYGITTSQVVLVDESRPTPGTDFTAEEPSRTLEVWLTLPERADPAPLVIFSHGMAGHPRKFEDLHAAWAEAGYAVAAPAFPLSNDTVEGSFTNIGDVPNQAGDVVFVLDQLLAMNDDGDSELRGRFDPERLATGGLSAGGATTYEAAVNALGNDRDDRFDAAIVMAGARFTSPDNGTFAAAEVPVFILHGDADPVVSYDVAPESYALLATPKYLLTLLGGGHAGPFEDTDDGFEDKAPGTDELVHAATIAFLDHHVLGIPEAGDELIVLAESAPELATFEYERG